MSNPRAKTFSAIADAKGVKEAMKVALPSSKKMIQAGFIYNENTDKTESGFPYLQYKYTRTLMNDFTFAMQIVANIQYAYRKALNNHVDLPKVKKYIDYMSRPGDGGTIHYLIHLNEKKGLLHRKYTVDAQKLSKSLNDENGFRGLLYIIYTQEHAVEFTTNKTRRGLIEYIIKKLQIKAKRMTNWITNGPDVARAILDVLNKTGIIKPDQFDNAEEFVQSLGELGPPTPPRPTQQNPAVPGVPPNNGGVFVPNPPPLPNHPAPTPPNNAGNTHTGVSQTIGSGATSSISIYWPKRLDPNPKYLETYKKLFVFDNQVTGFLMGNGWEDTEAMAYAPILSKTPTSREGSIFDVKEQRMHIERMSPEEKQDLLTIFRAIETAGTQFHNYKTIEVDLAGFTRMFIKGRELTRGIGGWKKTVESGISYLENSLGIKKSAQTASPLSKPVPAGVNHTLRDLADKRLGSGEKFNDDHRAVNPYKREKKFTAAKLPQRPEIDKLEKDEVTFDGSRRFYMTDGTGKCLRRNKTGGHNKAIEAGVVADSNNEKLRKYFAENPGAPGAKLECDVVFDEIEIPATEEKEYARKPKSEILILGSGKTGNGYDSVDLVFAAQYLFATGRKKIICLDAANEVTAGGTAGSTFTAAEESLCVDTSLYQSLTGGGMDEYYIDDKGGTSSKPRAAFHYNPNKLSIAKDVRIFERGDTPGTAKEIDGSKINELKTIDVMVHASPNFNSDVTNQCPSKTLDYTDEEAQAAINASANQMIKAAVQGGYDAFIINNLGGGVFMNSVTGWVNAWKDAISKFGKDLTIVFAIFDGKIFSDNYKNKKPYKPKETNAGRQVSDLYATTLGGKKKTKDQLKAEMRQASN